MPDPKPKRDEGSAGERFLGAELGRMTPTTGEHFGPYEILGTLGRGGVGEVYRAWDTRLEREVALKLLHDDYPQPGNKQRFMIEARAASALSHPSICTVFDIGEKNGMPYLVMELLKGETLKQRIEHGGIPSELVAQYGREIAEALEAAHALGIVHRDIKPANVMLVNQPDGNTRAKVLDFGLAKLTGPLPGRLTAHNEHLTVVGEAVGTVAYMSPEQARGEDLDGRSDLFSLGVLLYEMCTRHTPFHGSTSALLFMELLNSDPEPIREWNDSVPRALEKVIFRLLEKEPGRRYQSAAQAATALASVGHKISSSRWRRPAAPSVALVRVDEPVARPALPMRPDFRAEQGVVEFGLDVNPQRDQELVPAKKAASPAAAGRRPAPAAPVVRPLRSSGARFPAVAQVRLPAASSAPAVPAARRQEPALPPAMQASLDAPDPEPPSPVPLEAGPHSWAGGGFLRLSANAPVSESTVEEEIVTLRKRRVLRRAGVAAGALVVAAATVAAVRSSHGPPGVLGPADRVLVTEIENHTDAQTLDGSVAAGLELALAQSPQLALRGVEAYRAALHSIGADNRLESAIAARQAAQAAGARAYLYGEVRAADESAHSSGAGYTVTVALIGTSDNVQMARVEATAARTEEIPGAIDEIADGLRRQVLGSETPALLPLAREATGSLAALHSYALAERAAAEGRTQDALKDLSLAVAVDAGFVQAFDKISWLAGDEGAESASAHAAQQAQPAGGSRSQRTALLTAVAYEQNTQHAFAQAENDARRLVDANPQDAEALLILARVLRRQGRYDDALAIAERGLGMTRGNGALYREAELALIGLDRYDAALTLEDKAGASGQPHPAVTLMAGYLAGKAARAAEMARTLSADGGDVQAWSARAATLDNAGQLAAGETAWKEAADAARGRTGFEGADAALAAREALNRALAGECQAAVTEAEEAVGGQATASIRMLAGVAGALCREGGLVRAGSAAGAAGGLSPAESAAMRSAAALAAGEPEQAVRELDGAAADTANLLVPYLRGLAQLSSGDAPSAAASFRAVLAHRGAAVTTGTDLYPMAQLGLARALVGGGDLHASREAYGRFLTLWSTGSAGDALRAEASAGARGLPLPALRLFPERPILEAATEVATSEGQMQTAAGTADSASAEPASMHRVAAVPETSAPEHTAPLRRPAAPTPRRRTTPTDQTADDSDARYDAVIRSWAQHPLSPPGAAVEPKPGAPARDGTLE